MAEKKEQSLEDQSLEEIFSDLEQTIKEMEDGEISLEKSFRLYILVPLPPYDLKFLKMLSFRSRIVRRWQ